MELLIIAAVVAVSMTLSLTTHLVSKHFGMREQISSSVEDAAFESLSKAKLELTR